MGQTSSGWLVPHRPCGAPPADEPGARVRILLAEDRDVYREGLFVLLSEIANAEVVGTAVDRKELVHQSARLSPDVVVAGTSLVLPDGLPALSLARGCLREHRHGGRTGHRRTAVGGARGRGARLRSAQLSPRGLRRGDPGRRCRWRLPAHPCHPTSRQELPSGAPPHGQTGGTGAAQRTGAAGTPPRRRRAEQPGDRTHTPGQRGHGQEPCLTRPREARTPRPGPCRPTGVAARPRLPRLSFRRPETSRSGFDVATAHVTGFP